MGSKNDEIISHWSSSDIILVQIVDVLENSECESDRDNDFDHGDSNKMSPDTDSCDEDFNEDF